MDVCLDYNYTRVAARQCVWTHPVHCVIDVTDQIPVKMRCKEFKMQAKRRPVTQKKAPKTEESIQPPTPGPAQPGPSAIRGPKTQQLGPIRLSEGHQQRYERFQSVTPAGFHDLLEKIIRSAIVARPLHLRMFIADYLDAEMARRTFNEAMFGCQLRKGWLAYYSLP